MPFGGVRGIIHLPAASGDNFLRRIAGETIDATAHGRTLTFGMIKPDFSFMEMVAIAIGLVFLGFILYGVFLGLEYLASLH